MKKLVLISVLLVAVVMMISGCVASHEFVQRNQGAIGGQQVYVGQASDNVSDTLGPPDSVTQRPVADMSLTNNRGVYYLTEWHYDDDIVLFDDGRVSGVILKDPIQESSSD